MFNIFFRVPKTESVDINWKATSPVDADAPIEYLHLGGCDTDEIRIDQGLLHERAKFWASLPKIKSVKDEL